MGCGNSLLPQGLGFLRVTNPLTLFLPGSCGAKDTNHNEKGVKPVKIEPGSVDVIGTEIQEGDTCFSIGGEIIHVDNLEDFVIEFLQATVLIARGDCSEEKERARRMTSSNKGS